MPEAPHGFRMLPEPSPYFSSCAPAFEAGEGATYRLGLFVRHPHLNKRGLCHGGVLCALADVYLGHLAAQLAPQPVTVATISLSVAFLKPAVEGDWLECSGTFDRIGTSVATGTCLIHAAGSAAARAIGTFRILHAADGHSA